jgi:Sulfatase
MKDRYELPRCGWGTRNRYEVWIPRISLAGLSLIAVTSSSALPQQTTGTSGSPEATTTLDGRYLPAPPRKFQGDIQLNALQSKPAWPARVVPPKGAPNIMLIMTDDVGFAAPSTFGGVIPTPTLDRVAAIDQIFANQKKLGVIPQDAQLTPWPDKLLKHWENLTPEEKKLYIRQVEVYAAYLMYTDDEIGRVIKEVERGGKLDNTLIIYISGDNGASAEGTPKNAKRDAVVQWCRLNRGTANELLRCVGYGQNL